MAKPSVHILFVALLSLGLGSAAVTGEEARCTIAPGGAFPSTESTYLLGTATPDTLLSGQGPVTPTGLRGQQGSGRAPSVYGQVIRLERFGGADSATVARALDGADDPRIVVVPWAYDASCAVTTWNGSTRWVPLEERGLFRTPRLRDEEGWAEGLPTFDIYFARFEPYPLASYHREVPRDPRGPRRGPLLTVDEHVHLLQTFPRREVVQHDPEEGAVALTRWEAEHPDLATKYPAADALRSARSLIRSTLLRRHLDAIDSPIAGTWHLSFTLDGGEERDFFARTRTRPTTLMRLPARQEEPDPRLPPPPPEAYYLVASGALAPDSLPVDCGDGRDLPREGYLGLWVPPDASGEGRSEWRGRVDHSLINAQFPDEPALMAFRRSFVQERMRRQDRGEPPDPAAAAPALFTRAPDGTLRVEQTTRLEDGRVLTVRGRRISGETIACGW
jgi:hypothetical protein